MKQVYRGQVEAIEIAFSKLCKKLLEKASGTTYVPEIFEFQLDIKDRLEAACGELERRRRIIKSKKNKRSKLVKSPENIQQLLQELYFALSEENENDTQEVGFLHQFAREHNSSLHVPLQLELQSIRLQVERLLDDTNHIKEALNDECYIKAHPNALLTWTMICDSLFNLLRGSDSKLLLRQIKINHNLSAEDICSYYYTELSETRNKIRSTHTTIHTNLALNIILKLAEITHPEDGILCKACTSTDAARALVSQIHTTCEGLIAGKYTDLRPEQVIYDTPNFEPPTPAPRENDELDELRPLLPTLARLNSFHSISSAETEEDQSLRANPEVLRASIWHVELKPVSSRNMTHFGGQKRRAKRKHSEEDAVYAEPIDPNQAHGSSASSTVALDYGLRRISKTSHRPTDTDIDTIDEAEETRPPTPN